MIKKWIDIVLGCVLLVLLSAGKPITQPPDYCNIFGAVYIVESPRYADFKVYEEESEAFADLLIFEESNKLFADKQGIWFFTEDRAFADFTVYFTESQRGADFSVFFIDTESFAGCNK